MKVLVKEKLSEHKYKTPEGYLICVDAILARTGKQTYRRDEVFHDSDDTEIEVDRKAEEVFSPQTLASFENKPVTVEHPGEDVNSENYKEYAVGFVRDVHQGKADGQDVILGTLVIQDAQTIEEIENGEHVELSCGYDCDIDDSENPQQRNIRGNHVALCECGRAGNARIVDSVRDTKYKIGQKWKGRNGMIVTLVEYDGIKPIVKYGFTKERFANDLALEENLLKYNDYKMIDSIKDSKYIVHFKHKNGGDDKDIVVEAKGMTEAVEIAKTYVSDYYYKYVNVKPHYEDSIKDATYIDKYGERWSETDVEQWGEAYGYSKKEVINKLELKKVGVKDTQRFGITPRFKWLKGNRRPERIASSLEEARYIKSSCERVDGIRYIIFDLDTFKVYDSCEDVDIEKIKRKLKINFDKYNMNKDEAIAEVNSYKNLTNDEIATLTDWVYEIYNSKKDSCKDKYVNYKGFIFEDYDEKASKFFGFTKDKEVQEIDGRYIIYIKNAYHSELYKYIPYGAEGFTVVIEDGLIRITKLNKYSNLQSKLIKAAQQIENTNNIIFDSCDEETPYEEVTEKLEKNIDDDNTIHIKNYLKEKGIDCEEIKLEGISGPLTKIYVDGKYIGEWDNVKNKLKDSTKTYIIRWRDLFENNTYVANIEASNMKEAIEKLKDKIIKYQVGTDNVRVDQVQSKKGNDVKYHMIYGKLNELLNKDLNSFDLDSKQKAADAIKVLNKFKKGK